MTLAVIMEKYPLIRKIYLYLFTIVGLSLIVIGAVKLIDLGLKMTVFKQADSQQYSYQKMPLSAPISEQKLDNIVSGQGNAQLTEEEKAQIQRWLADYKAWQETQIRHRRQSGRWSGCGHPDQAGKQPCRLKKPYRISSRPLVAR